MGKYFLVGVVLLVISSLLLASCSTTKVFRQQQKFYETHIVGNSDISQQTLNSDNGVLHYAVAGNPQYPALVFIHGTPGNWQSLSDFLVEPQLRQYFQIFVIDRPGWGASIDSAEHPVTSFSYQAEQIAGLLQQLRQQNSQRRIILVGHSLGASIAPRVAVDYPQLVDGLLLLSGSHDPKLAKPRYYHRVGNWPVVKTLIGKSLRKANKEMLVLDQQLSEMDGKWPTIKIPITVIQGDKDPLVNPHNTEFLQRVQKHNPSLKVIRLDDIGHFTHLQSQDLVAKSAIELLDEVGER